MDIDEARDLLHAHNLRVTLGRLALLRTLADAERPLAHREVVETITEDAGDPATIFRNLVRFAEAGLLRVLTRSGGLDRYELQTEEAEEEHPHPHFFCKTCGEVTCLPADLLDVPSMRGAWRRSLQEATFELQGQCPNCRATREASPAKQSAPAKQAKRSKPKKKPNA
jgi:Fur family ferric uptake transcriptional regulator